MRIDITRRRLGLAMGLLLGAACARAPREPARPPAASRAAPEPEASAIGATKRAAARANPFADARMYVNPDFARKVESSLPASAAAAERFRGVARQPTAVWLDAIARVPDVSRHLDEARAQERAAGVPVVTTFVLYDLPNRDCAARASAGELAVEADGEARYRREYVDRIAEQLRARPSQRVALVVEPDSLANLATNLDVPRCAASEAVYRRSIAYAIRALSLPNVSIYLDAAHAGWLGWDANRAKIARVYADVLAEAGGPGAIRGFSTNVSNYNVVHGEDGRRLEPSDPCPDEATYVAKLAESLAAVGVTNVGFVIDTSRDGRAGIRARWGHWCNVKGAGLGPRPQPSPAPRVDAFLWIKTPGESDGTSDPRAARFDPTCASPDSAPDAPEAGAWFPSYFAALVANADPPP